MNLARLSSLAQQDLDAIWDYIARDNIKAADRWIDKLSNKLDLYGREPLLGEARSDLGAAIRQFSFGNYVVFYRPVADSIEVVRVLHAARNIRRRDLE